MRAHGYLSLVGLLLAACNGPGEEGAQVGSECVQNDLVAQCPPGSNPILGASAESMCEASASVDLTTESGAVSGRCFGAGSCRVACQFASPCRCGVDAVTREGVFCTPCADAAACGDGLCDRGENPMTCPEDCNAECTPNEERCQATAREVCDGTGHWMQLECDVGQTCTVDSQGATRCVRDDVFQGGETGEPVPREERVDGRVWFGDGRLPPEGTGTSAVDAPVPNEGYVLESLFFVRTDFNQRIFNKPIARAGYRVGHQAASETQTDWRRRIFPADTDVGDYLVLWGPKRAIRLDLLGNDPPAEVGLVDAEYPAEMAGPAEDGRLGLTGFATWSADLRSVLWARKYETFSGPGGWATDAEILLFDARTGENRLLGRTGIYGLNGPPPVLSADGRSAAVSVAHRGSTNQVVMGWRDGTPVRPLRPSRLGEPASGLSVAAVSPSGALLATFIAGGRGPRDGELRCSGAVDLWNLHDGKRIYTLCMADGVHDWSPGTLLFAPGGDRLAIHGSARIGQRVSDLAYGVETWDLTRGKEEVLITTSGNGKVQYTPDGRWLVVSNSDPISEVTLWDPLTGAIHATVLRWDPALPDSLPNHETFPDPASPGASRVARIDGMAFSPKGTRLLLYGSSEQGSAGIEWVATLRAGGAR